MRRTHAREALGLGLDHRAKVVAAVGALLLQVGADGDQVYFVQCLCEQGAIRVATVLVGDAECALGGVKRQQRIFSQATQAGATGPQERGGIVRHASSHGVEVDVTHAPQIEGVRAIDFLVYPAVQHHLGAR